MEKYYKKEGRYSYYEAGEGTPIVVLHGLMGGLSNFDAVASYFSEKGYKIVIPDLPIYTQNILKTNVKAFAKYVKDFITFKGFDRVILLGNSLGGHIALYHTKMYPEKVAGLVLTGSSGLYESAMGDSYPKRGDYEYIKKKAQAVFYDPAMATKELVDEVYASVNDRIKLIKTLTIAKIAIRHNMSKDLLKINEYEMEKQIENKLPQIRNLFSKDGAKKVFVFGSAATNKFNENSDVDFLYTFPEDLDYETYANNYFNLLYELQDLLKKQVDLVAEKTLRNPYLIESINESKIQLL